MFASRQSKNYDEVKADFITSHGYFQGHECSLSADKITNYEIKGNRMRKYIVNLVTVNAGDVRARNMFRSYAALCAEKRRQYKHYPFSLHPFSKLRLWLEVLFVAVMLVANASQSIVISRANPSKHDYILTTSKYLDKAYALKIIASFFTGHIEGNTCQHVVLDLRKIAKRYLMTWFVFDVASSLPHLDIVTECPGLTLCLSLESLKLFRLPALFMYSNNLVTVLKIEVVAKTLIELSLYLFCYLSWNVYFQYAVEYLQDDTFQPSNPRTCSWLAIGNMGNQTSCVRFTYALERAVGMLRGNANINLLKTEGCFENFLMVSWVIAKIIVLHCAFKYIIALSGSESACANYFMMAKQVEAYMNQRKFPSKIKKKILKFYALRFQSHFFVESRVMSCVSGQLREDLIMYSGRQLVRDVDFLKHIPRTLLVEVALRLRTTIFIAGDVIMKINTIDVVTGDKRAGSFLAQRLSITIQRDNAASVLGTMPHGVGLLGDCMYFIDKGTVAIYSESGKEICHLEDGDFFGEIALIAKHKLRTATAVAVTNCELFRMDRNDFDESIARYQTLYEDIEKVAVSREERAQVLNEHHKAERKGVGDQSDI